MFKKLLALILAIQVVISVPGVTLFAHYCNGALATLSILSQEDPCQSIEGAACCKVSSQSAQSRMPACCQSNSDESQCALNGEDCCDTRIVSSESFLIAAFRPAVSLQRNAELQVFSALLFSQCQAHPGFLMDHFLSSPVPDLPISQPSGPLRCARLSCFLI